jgi:hypothetical protein
MTPEEMLGWLAAGLTLLTFSQRSMIPLRLAALGSNLSFIAYGSLCGLPPILALHLILLPCNLLRLGQLLSDRRRQRRPAAFGLGVGPALWDLRCGAGWTPEALADELVAAQRHLHTLQRDLGDGASHNTTQELAAALTRIGQALPPCVDVRPDVPDRVSMPVSTWRPVAMVPRVAGSASGEPQAAQRSADLECVDRQCANRW